MIKKVIFIVLISFASTNIIAQEDLAFKSINNDFARPQRIFKISLLSVLDFNSPSLQAGVEFKINDKVGIHQELGYVNNWINPIYTLIDHGFSKRKKMKNGLKYSIESRFYIFNKKKLLSSRMFLSPSFDFRYVVIQRQEWASTNNFSYQKLFRYNVRRLAYGFNVKFGYTTGIKNNFPIEVVFGLGVRYVSLRNTLPSNITLNNGGNNVLVPRVRIKGDNWLPSAYIGMLLQLPYFKKM